MFSAMMSNQEEHKPLLRSAISSLEWIREETAASLPKTVSVDYNQEARWIDSNAQACAHPSGSRPFKLSDDLIARDEQLQALIKSYERSKTKDHQPELTLITGKSGAGKTSLAFELKTHVERDSGYFLVGKFEQNQFMGLPYHALIHAYSDFVDQAMKRSAEDKEDLKMRIGQAIESDSKLITDLIPSLKQLVQDCAETSSPIKWTDLQLRLKRVLCRFMRAISSPKAPVVLMLDDLQWSDVSSLDLLSDIVAETQSEGSMIIGACRDDEVSSDHQLAVFLRNLEAARLVQINEIQVPPLDQSAVTNYLSQSFSLPTEKCRLLAETVHAKTNGNIFFLKRYVQWLIRSNMIKVESDGNWQFDKNLIPSLRDFVDVVQLIAADITQGGSALRCMLEIASCLGSGFHQDLLAIAFDDDELEDMNGTLTKAIDKEFLFVEERTGVIRFTHDKVEQACYSLIPEVERIHVHLELGRKLWRQCSTEDLDTYLFTVVNQLIIGIDQVTGLQERNQIAGLCLRAAEKACVASMFSVASGYLDQGVQLLTPKHWRDEYELSLSLFNAQCEVKYTLGDFEVTDEAVEFIFRNARSFQDKLSAYLIKVYALGAKGRAVDAMSTGFQVLEKLGVRFPVKGRVFYIVREFFRTKSLLKHMSHDDILNLPTMYHPDKLAAMRMLAILVPYAFSHKPEFLPLITFRMIQLTIHWGIGVMSSATFASYGMLLSGSFGLVDEGYRYGQLALKLAYKFKAQEWYPRCHAAVYGMINTWKNPLKDSLQPLQRSYVLGMSTGDIEFGMLCSAIYSTIATQAAECNLVDLAEQMRGFRDSMIAYKQDGMLLMLLPTLQFVDNLRGLANDPLVLTGDAMNQDAALKEASESNNISVSLQIFLYLLVLGYYTGAHHAADLAANERAKIKSAATSCFGEGEQRFFECLNCLALARIGSKRYHMRRARKKYKEFAMIARYGRRSLQNRLTLLDGEFSAVARKIDDAVAAFKAAAEHAALEGDRTDEALACERAGNVFRDENLWNESRYYLSRACEIYEQWGAAIRVKYIRECLPQ